MSAWILKFLVSETSAHPLLEEVTCHRGTGQVTSIASPFAEADPEAA